ncbi:unnamed protein product, partial [Amoebophrya sp. A120]|eukprot:GSA120T00013748001.1
MQKENVQKYVLHCARSFSCGLCAEGFEFRHSDEMLFRSSDMLAYSVPVFYLIRMPELDRASLAFFVSSLFLESGRISVSDERRCGAYVRRSVLCTGLEPAQLKPYCVGLP